jgi:hypothetical protein
MKEGFIKIGDEKRAVGERLTIGRTPENDISFETDSNVSRRHAEIERRADGFYLRDLGSSNGTAVNGIPIQAETRLQNGDYIILGNSATLVFNLEGEDEPAEAEAAAASEAQDLTPEEQKSNKILLAGAAGALGLALVIGGGAMYLASGSGCNARAEIISPEPGETLKKPTEIEVNIENAGCVGKAVYLVDDVEFAKADSEPFTATIDPNEHPDLTDGLDHALIVRLYDKKGELVYQPAPVFVAFESQKVKPPEKQEIAGNQSTQQAEKKAKELSLIEIQQMTVAVASKFPRAAGYNVSNRQFLEEIRKKTAEYAIAGYSSRAEKFRDEINVAFVTENNLDAPLGFYLAMSRSKFDPAKQGSEEGIFRMSNEFVLSNAYNGLCGSETLSDPKQSCASKSAALYMKALVYGVFGGDVLLSVAAFGKSPLEAGTWKASLPVGQKDIWSMVRTPAEREQLVNFFAAAVVGENPKRFGLEQDRPLSEFYRIAM